MSMKKNHLRPKNHEDSGLILINPDFRSQSVGSSWNIFSMSRKVTFSMTIIISFHVSDKETKQKVQVHENNTPFP